MACDDVVLDDDDDDRDEDDVRQIFLFSAVVPSTNYLFKLSAQLLTHLLVCLSVSQLVSESVSPENIIEAGWS